MSVLRSVVEPNPCMTKVALHSAACKFRLPQQAIVHRHVLHLPSTSAPNENWRVYVFTGQASGRGSTAAHSSTASVPVPAYDQARSLEEGQRAVFSVFA